MANGNRIDTKKIRILMIEREYDSQKSLAEDVGVTKQSLNRILRNPGPRGPTLEMIVGICRMLRCRIEDIVVQDWPIDNA